MQEREILFRGKRVDNGEWVYGYYTLYGQSRGLHPAIITGTEEGCVIPAFIDPETRGQYTGLTDKNNKKIFEGDIVAFTDCTSTENGYSEQYCVGEVVWNNETLSYEVTNRLSAESYEVLIECTVIGNIHDNPELLEE